MNHVAVSSEQRQAWALRLAQPLSLFAQMSQLQAHGVKLPIFKPSCKYSLNGLSPAQMDAIEKAVLYITSQLEPVVDLSADLRGIGDQDEACEEANTAIPSTADKQDAEAHTKKAGRDDDDDDESSKSLAPRCQISVACGGGKTAILLWVFLLVGGPALVLTNNSENKTQFLSTILSDTNLDELGEVKLIAGQSSVAVANDISQFTGFTADEHVVPASSIRTLVLCDSNHLNDLANGTAERKSLNAQMLSSRWRVILVDEAEETVTPKVRDIVRFGLNTSKGGKAVVIPFPNVPIVFTSGTLLSDDRYARAFFSRRAGPLLHVSFASELEERGLLAKSRMAVVLCRREEEFVLKSCAMQNSQLSGMLPSAVRAIENIVTLHGAFQHKVVIFTWYVEQARTIKRLFPSAEVVIGGDVGDARTKAFDRFEAPFGVNHPGVFGTTTLKQRGWDHPQATVCISLACESAIYLDQRAGRVKRKCGDKVAYFYVIVDDTPEKRRGWGEGKTIDIEAVVNSNQFKLLCLNGYREKLKAGVMTAEKLANRVQKYLFSLAPPSHTLDENSPVVFVDSAGKKQLITASRNLVVRLAHTLHFFETTLCYERKNENHLTTFITGALEIQRRRAMHKARFAAGASSSSSSSLPAAPPSKVISKRAAPKLTAVSSKSSLSNKFLADQKKRASAAAAAAKKEKRGGAEAPLAAAAAVSERTKKDLVESGLNINLLQIIAAVECSDADADLEALLSSMSAESTNEEWWTFLNLVFDLSLHLCKAADEARRLHRNISFDLSTRFSNVRCTFLQ